jgi:hypothetical protein
MPTDAEEAPMRPAPQIFLTLSADAVEDEHQRSRVRKAFMLGATLLVMLSAPLFWTAGTAQGSGGDAPDAVANKPAATTADDDDDDDDDDTNSGSGGGTGTDNTRGDRNDTNTRGNTGNASDRQTGRETAGKTDRGGQNTGKSTRGETDPGDKTGKTERR